MKALGVLESKWDQIRKKLVRRLLDEQETKTKKRAVSCQFVSQFVVS
jgi:hypothetical protein